ncbi:MAG: Sec-independent protein translocase protein TatB [Burkholderiales bacterium]
MFDLSFIEIVIIAVVMLLVVGPERLPKVARTLGHLFGRMQRYVTDIKTDINREIELDELRKLQSSMQDAARDIEESVSKQVKYVESEVKEAEDQARKSVESLEPKSGGISLMPKSEPGEPSGVESRDHADDTSQLELGLDKDEAAEPAKKQA